MRKLGHGIRQLSERFTYKKASTTPTTVEELPLEEIRGMLRKV